MLSALGKDLTGSADICSIVVSNFSGLAATPYVLSTEELLFAFASPKEEFVFTDEALIKVKGASAANPRKLVERFEYRDHEVSNVQFQTSGRLDRDCELRFSIGDEQVTIEIRRKEEAHAKTFFNALLALSRAQEQRQQRWDQAKSALESTLTQSKPRTRPGVEAGNVGSATSMTVVDQASMVFEQFNGEFERLNARSYIEVLRAEIARAV